MEKIILKPYPVKPFLSEIPQSVNVKFAFVNDKYEQVSLPGKCRDFLGDVLWSREKKAPVSIYGFRYSYEENPYDTNTLRLSLTFPDEEIKNTFISNLNLIKEKDEQARTSETKFFETDQKDTLLLEADPAWQSSVWKLSLYTMYLKFMCYKSFDELKKPEDTYYNSIKEHQNVFLSKIKDNVVYWRDVLYRNHNEAGVVSLVEAFQGCEEFSESAKEEMNYIFGSVN